MKGPRLTNTQSRGMRDGTTRYATGTPCPVKEPRGHAIASCERHRLTAGDRKPDAAVSPVIAELLFLALTILLASVIAATLFGLIQLPETEETTPEILKIVSISHTNAGGKLTYAGIIQLKNVGYESLPTRDYGLYLSVNGKQTGAVIQTLNSHDFIPTEHDVVRLLYGVGPQGDRWHSGALGTLDIADKTIVSESLVTIEVYEVSTGKIISRSEMYAPEAFP